MPNVLNEFTGDGVTQTFNFSMTGGYLSRDYVYFFTRPNDDLLNYTPYNDDDVTWLTDFSVRTANPIPVGTTLVILRSTTLDPLVDFQNTSRITEKNLDTATWQSIHIAAETSDTVGRIQVVASDAMKKAGEAARLATDAAQSSSMSEAAARAAQLAAQSAQAAALEAQEDADAAAASAATAQQQSTEALQVAQQADDKSTSALQLAQRADGNASAADSKANSAVSTAGQANATANAANNTAGQANATANAADAKANTAVQTANQATATADAALGLVGQAVSGSVVSFNGRQGAVIPADGDYDKFKVGLHRVDNTADADKPVSGPQQAALDLKADKAATQAALDTKADFTTVNNAMSLKANQSDVNSSLSTNSQYDTNRANHTGTQPYTTVSGLGSVVTKDHTVSQGDYGSNRAMLVGAFGLGAKYDGRGMPFHGNLPPNMFFGKGTVFMFADGGAGDPTALRVPGLANYSYGVLTIHAHYHDVSAASALQRWFMYNGRMWQSVADSSTTWGPWYEYVNSGNISKFTAGAANRLATVRSINGQPFDGTQNVDIPMLGRNQKWVLVSRSTNVTYYNTTAAPIVVNVSTNVSNATVEVFAVIGGTRIRVCGESSPAAPRPTGNFIVPPGSAYSLESYYALGDIHELRQ